MLTLAIDTSTNVLSVALLRGETVLTALTEPTKNNQSEILMSRISELMQTCNLTPSVLEKIVVAVGPGSYTGIRVGVAAAKSLAYALDIPIVGVSSLEVMAHLLFECGTDDDLVAALIDARRGTVFAAVYDSGGALEVAAGHFELKVLLEKIPSEKSISFVGDETLASKAQWVRSEQALDQNKAVVAAKLAKSKAACVDVHGLVPNYLRKTEAELNLNG